MPVSNTEQHGDARRPGIGGVLAEFHACSQPGPLSRCLQLSRSDPGLLGWPIHSGVSLCRYLIARAPALRFLLLW